MNSSDAVRRGLNIRFHERWSRADGRFVTELNQPDDADLRVMLMTLRKFVLESSDVYVQGIHNIVYKRVARGTDTVSVDQVRTNVGEMNKSWKHEFDAGFLRLIVSGQEIPPKSAMDLWLNGRYFHDDPDYADALTRMEQGDPLAAIFVRWQFLSAVLCTAQYVDWLAGNVDYLLTNNMLDLDSEGKD